MTDDFNNYKELFDSMDIGIIFQNTKAEIIEANTVAEKILGYSKKQLFKLKIKSKSGKAIGEDGSLIPWQEHPSIVCLKTGKKIKNKVMGIINPKANELCWINVNTVPIFRKGLKKPYQVVSSFYDITELKKASEALIKSEKKFRDMIENSAEAIMLLDKNGKIIYDSPTITKLSGYSPEERLGKNPLELVFFKDRKKMKILIEKLYSEYEGKVYAKFRGVKKDGTIWWIEGTATNMLNNPNINAIVINYRDISLRKEAEDRLKLTQFGIDHSQIAVFQLDDSGRVYYANEQACKSLGYSQEEMLKLSITDFNVSVNMNKWLENRKITAQLGSQTVETIHKRKDGTTFPVEVTINFVEFEGKKQSFSFVRDLTEMKKAEEALQVQFREYKELNKQYKKQNQELQQSLEQISNINLELANAKQKAEESDRLKTAFLANMSHEIRTPMNGILGFTELLKEPDLTGDEHAKYLEVIQKSGNRMLSIINDLIDISKIEAGQVELSIAPVSINKLLDSLYEFFLPDAEKKGLTLIFRKELTDNRSIIETDEIKLNQVLSNLIKNALKYTYSGQIKFGYMIKNSSVIFYVMDTGIGIKPENQEKIFERFRQGDTYEERVIEGSGLGLSISKAFMEILGGKIWVKSEPGKGSVFYVSLPYKCISDISQNNVPSENKTENILSGSLILVAEDDEICFRYLEEALKKNNIRLLRACNGNEVVSLVKSNKDIQLVLMDIKMPFLNGLEATKIIKKYRPDIPVIAQTAYAQTNDSKLAFQAGCDDYIAKPINKDLLISKIKKHLTC